LTKFWQLAIINQALYRAGRIPENTHVGGKSEKNTFSMFNVSTLFGCGPNTERNFMGLLFTRSKRSCKSL
jgi:hypothetical protein